jgi:hypothetical protein
MEDHTFVDGIGRIAIIDGIVRVDFFAHSPTEMGPDGKPRMAFAHRIVIGADQFLRAAEKIAESVRLIQQHQQQAQQHAPQPQTPVQQQVYAQQQAPVQQQMPPNVQQMRPPQQQAAPVQQPAPQEASFGRKNNGQHETPPPASPQRPFP